MSMEDDAKTAFKTRFVLRRVFFLSGRVVHASTWTRKRSPSTLPDNF